MERIGAQMSDCIYGHDEIDECEECGGCRECGDCDCVEHEDFEDDPDTAPPSKAYPRLDIDPDELPF